MPRAAVCRSFSEPLSIEDVRLEPPGPGEVHVRIRACAVCQSDVAYAAGAWGGELPAVYGHEACGEVVETGAGVAAPRVGERVVVSLIRSCGACARCREGSPALCEATFPLDERSPIVLADGTRAVQGMRCGTFAEEAVVHASQAVAVPADVPDTSACLIACAVMTGVGAVVHDGAVTAGQSVVVIGAGGVGLNAVQAAADAGAHVTAVDVSAAKLATARALGAAAAIDASAADTVARVRAATGGAGADTVVVTAGSAAAVDDGLACLRRGGTLVCVGMPPTGQAASFDPGALAHDGKRIVGSKLGSSRPDRDVARIAALYAQGRLHLDELVTATYPLERINEAIESMRRGEAIRNVIVP
jgi:S-(hydroxymethyl)glutathione dehydrogenase/alcohol dehydrogenase